MTSTIAKLLMFIALTALLAACSRFGYATNSGPVFGHSQAQVTQNQTVANLPQQDNPQTSVPSAVELPQSGLESGMTDYIETAALTNMSTTDKNEASSAQYFALQTGRPGAPRSWSGDNGTTGKVLVGPFIRVNNLDCREFTHTVTLSGQEYSKSGTSCRENGNWTVVQN